MTALDLLEARLRELRESFDRSFVEPPSAQAVETVDVIEIRAGRERLALRLSEIRTLEADRPITVVPSVHPELLGVAGMRGAVVAVFDLAALLDLPRAESARWLVLAKGAPIALAFSGFDGQRTLRREQLARAEVAGPARELIRHEGVTLPLIDIPVLIARLEQRPRRSTPQPP